MYAGVHCALRVAYLAIQGHDADMKRIQVVVGCAVILPAVLMLSGCGSSANDSSTTPTVTATPADDILGQTACDDFRIMVSDIHKGVVADTEIRGKIQDIYKNGQYSTSAGIADDITALLAADTNNDTKAITSSSVALDKACTAIGH